MPNKLWLLLDVPNLIFRSAYSTGALQHDGENTGIVYGFFRDVLSLQELHCTKNVVFAFDLGQSRRKMIFPEYKSARKDKAKEALHVSVYEQLHKLRTDYLPYLGFRNLFAVDGFEADDVIGSVCRNLPGTDEALIVSTDHDFYQLLNGERVKQWKPTANKVYTQGCLFRDFGVTPAQWVRVKAMAGCTSDGIPGIPGVGEKTACSYIRKQLPTHYKAYTAIARGSMIVQRNAELVRLPMPGVPTFELQEDSVSPDAWRNLFKELGIKSLGNF